ncbi:helix-turn-helix domain containing protein [Mycobacterium sp. CVI_P3]|uniref:Helix-turn-helix domain containing protein n=1 Tax=Mycobacterium pinniadriaticum TaxID=2994102 RepID=A0ABT3SJ18_9MYCO|nr:helix-turn-helix domain-containing protein [Mycobacterium pinniadriaticum]MCX2933174.1 helix-turn-helix domain containing protein [Mycobacterium pinniadriaticum]MCX2939526.1 helix-turn-helix domain containing protein [Mycobacterium pinniadriaticum]
MTTEGAITVGERAATPVGRDEVVAATLEAAADLFAARGPAATSIRDVAARAGVNHGLLHRHFGTKEQLVGAVLDYLGQQLAAALASAQAAEIDAAADRQLRVIARAILDGYPVGQLQTGFPNIGLLLSQLRDSHPTEESARLAAAHLMALQLGWRLFGDFLRASTGIDGIDDETLQHSIGEAAKRAGSPAGS